MIRLTLRVTTFKLSEFQDPKPRSISPNIVLCTSRQRYMGNYRFIPEEQKKLVITMLDRGQIPADIENATGIGARTVQRVRRLWLSIGRVILEETSIGARSLEKRA